MKKAETRKVFYKVLKDEGINSGERECESAAYWQDYESGKRLIRTICAHHPSEYDTYLAWLVDYLDGITAA